MVSFHAKTGWDRLSVIQKEKLSFWSIPNQPRIGNSKKIKIKIQNLKNNIILHLKQKRVGTSREWYNKKSYCSDSLKPDLE